MNRTFTNREKVLLLILTLILLFVGYTKVVAQPVAQRMADAQLLAQGAQDEMVLELAKAQRLESMKQSLAQSGHTVQTASIPDYDNLENVMVQLDAILGLSQEYSLIFSDVTFGEDGLVSRPIQMIVSCASYEAAKQVMERLAGCVYSCSLNDITVTASGGEASPDVTKGPVTVALTATFYETIT
ncbi:hypothetical protein KQI82_11510 [Oscillibacter sp. MSJ-2]|uniref:Uncharacterized protein n=1 Tax=Dysosmobacter acutus TaxID=2841504 RepID=A0ABS6FBJ1_9FIRM|nr:hypothetical protein [Dysosmobacter acutus]MBU5627537.1 hypothetical protein [Dysosmobacter acutus]